MVKYSTTDFQFAAMVSKIRGQVWSTLISNFHVKTLGWSYFNTWINVTKTQEYADLKSRIQSLLNKNNVVFLLKMVSKVKPNKVFITQFIASEH